MGLYEKAILYSLLFLCVVRKISRRLVEIFLWRKSYNEIAFLLFISQVFVHNYTFCLTTRPFPLCFRTKS